MPGRSVSFEQSASQSHRTFGPMRHCSTHAGS